MCYLSIIIPVYNAEKYLKKCLDSLCYETNKYEVIIVNDGSTDESDSICFDYSLRYSNIQYVRKTNGGVTSARKEACRIVKGKYILCVDSDDYLLPEAINVFVSSAQKFDNDLILYGFTDDEGDHYPSIREGVYCADDLNRITTNFFYDKSKGGENKGSIFYELWTKMIKKDLYVKYQNQIDDSLVVGEDAVLTYLCLKNAKNVRIKNYAGYYYRKSETSVMNSYSSEKVKKHELFVQTVTNILSDDLITNYLSYCSFLNIIKSAAFGSLDYKDFKNKISNLYSSILWTNTNGLKLNNCSINTNIKMFLIKNKLSFIIWLVFRCKTI